MREKQYKSGVDGEKRAEQWLTGRGMQTVARRWRGGKGEIDLIMRDGKTLVFVEVKYRPSGAEGAGLAAITPDKQRRMISAASAYLAESSGGFEQPVRFDAVEITASGLSWLKDAFRP